MACTNMNTQMGTKWFTFYTKVRPWLSCVFSLPFITDFIQYTDVYLEHWWLVVYAVFSFAAPVLSVMVFVKSRDDYEKFVGFVTGVLFFESVCFPYQFCVQQYVANSMDGFSVLVIFAVALVLYYFLWFRLNVKYFTKRIITKESMPLTIEKPCVVRNHYCTNCGSKISDNVNFCGNCGAKVISNQTE